LKPEATAVSEGVKLEKIIELSTKAITDAGVTLGAIRVVGGPYLEKHNTMVEHYGVISKISKEGESAISDTARENLKNNENLKEFVNSKAEVIGGHDFLKRFDKFTPFSLLVLNDNLGTTRLAGGTYAMKVKVLGKPFIVLNPFHAYQVVPYTTEGNAIIVFEGQSKKSWADLRNKVSGVTDPTAAEEGSIRNLFLKSKSDLGLKDVDKGTNGVHLSAGPLEGMVELQRFFSDRDSGKDVPYSATAFGAYLQSKGLSEDDVKKVATNPDVNKDGKKVSLFDLTEEHSFDKAGEVITNEDVKSQLSKL
jgi:nucleoside diphosphate kinase